MTQNTYLSTLDEIWDYLDSVFSADRRSREESGVTVRSAEILGGCLDDRAD